MLLGQLNLSLGNYGRSHLIIKQIYKRSLSFLEACLITSATIFFCIFPFFKALILFPFFLWFLSVYRIYTSILFHGSLLHVLFNMLALVPLGSELERIMGSLRLLHVIFLLATSNAILHLLIALVVAHNPVHSDAYLMNECAIGFSGIIFSMIVMETSLSGVQSRRLVELNHIINENCRHCVVTAIIFSWDISLISATFLPL